MKNLSAESSSKLDVSRHNPSLSVGKTSLSNQVLFYFFFILHFWTSKCCLMVLVAIDCQNDVIILIQGAPSGGVILLDDADVLTCGAKAAACGRLASLAAVSSKGNTLAS